MKSFALIALAGAVSAVDVMWQGYGGRGGYGGYGGYAKVDYVPQTRVVQPARQAQAASKAYGQDYARTSVTDFDAYGRDQDLSINESYGNTGAKSYRAESYDEWDNKDRDTHSAQAWGKDRDLYGASSQEYDASRDDYDRAAQAYAGQQYGSYGKSAGHGHGHGWGKGGYGGASYGGSYGQAYGGQQAAAAKQGKASWQGASQAQKYDDDEWAKQAQGTDYDSRWGKSYDAVEAKSFDNEHYEREVIADDDQWAEDRDTYARGDLDEYGRAASASASGGKGGYGGYGLKGGSFKDASKQGGSDYWGGSRDDFDAYGRDQDFHEKVSFDNTRAKGYAAESYDEWDNTDDDSWGAQAWGTDKDLHGASSYSGRSSAGKYGQSYGSGSGKLGYGKGGSGAYGASDWEGASKGAKAAQGAYDNDAWAKQAYGQDKDSRYGKSYDSVKARSYDGTRYARWLQADDDQWAEDRDLYNDGDINKRAGAASTWRDTNGYGGYGLGYGKGRGEYDAASAASRQGVVSHSGKDWDAYGRDQDLEVDESYEQTWAKSYDAESYDEWDNRDDDKWGAQAWGVDKDVHGASSYGSAASAGDYDRKGYGDAGYGGYGYGSGYGSGLGGYGGYGAGYGVGYGSKGYGKSGYGQAGHKDYAASAGAKAARSGYDDDSHAQQAYGTDSDSRWGKSYDFVQANEYDDEQYARKVRADDDQWAEDRDEYVTKEHYGYDQAASAEARQPKITQTTYHPRVQYGGYGYGGYGGW